MNDRRLARIAVLLASVSAAALVVEPVAASAQSAPPGYGQDTYGQSGASSADAAWPDAPPPGAAYGQTAPADPGPPAYAGPPPSAQYAPAPQYAAQPQYAPPPRYAPPPQAGGPGYYAPSQSSYEDYQARYGQWAARNCASQHNSSTAAGAIFGGAAGALMGFSLAGWAARGFWTVFGGTVGASLGAIVGSSANSGDCRNAYAAWAGPPAYAYAGPAAYAPPVYAPAPVYRRGGWIWAGDHWVRRPYGYGGWRYRPAGYPGYRY